MKYPFTVSYMYVDDLRFWVAKSNALKGCVGQGDTPEEAINELSTNEIEWLKTAKEYGIDIPEIPVEPLTTYSGKFTVRVAPHVHQEAVEHAKQQNISLNQYVNDAIVAQNASVSTVNAIIPQVKRIAVEIKKAFYGNTLSVSSGKSSRLFSFNKFDFEDVSFGGASTSAGELQIIHAN